MKDALMNNYPGGVKSYNEVYDSNGNLAGYYCRSNNLDEIYIPANTTGNVGMVSYIPGSGGSGNDAKMLRELINSGNPPDYVITIAASCSDHNNCMENGLRMAQAADLNVTDNVTVCFSASGFLGVDRTNSFSANHPDIQSTVISCEPYNTSYLKMDRIQGLVDGNVPVVFVAPDSGFHINMLNKIEELKKHGINAYLLETDYGSNAHIATNRDILTNGILEYILGERDDFDITRAGGYDFLTYDPESGKVVYANYEDLANSKIGAVRIPNIDKIKSVDSFNITEEISPISTKYANLGNKKDIHLVSKSGSLLASNYTYANTSIDNIRSYIKNTASNFSTFNFRSTSGIPGCLSGYLNKYFDYINSLLSSLSAETESVMSYAQAVVDYDEELKQGLNIGSIVRTGDIDYIKYGLSENSNDKNKRGGSTPTGHAGGGGNQPSDKLPEYVYEFDGYNGIITMDGDKIKEIKFEYTYKNKVEANNNLPVIKEKYSRARYVETIKVVENTIDVVFKEETFKDLTYKQVVDKYFKGGKLRG